jgi:hypothetical protein
VRSRRCRSTADPTRRSGGVFGQEQSTTAGKWMASRAGPPGVTPVRIDCRPSSINAPVGIQAEHEERGGRVPSGKDLPDRAAFNRSAMQIRRVLSSSGGALDRLGWRIQRGESATALLDTERPPTGSIEGRTLRLALDDEKKERSGGDQSDGSHHGH